MSGAEHVSMTAMTEELVMSGRRKKIRHSLRAVDQALTWGECHSFPVDSASLLGSMTCRDLSRGESTKHETEAADADHVILA